MPGHEGLMEKKQEKYEPARKENNGGREPRFVIRALSFFVSRLRLLLLALR
jgi:hypothetical protein